MSKRVRFSAEEKLLSVESILNGRVSKNSEVARLGIVKSVINEWIRKFESYGFEGLKESRTWQHYSKELKIAAVESVVSGRYSNHEATKKYEISDRSVLRRWIKAYTSGKELQPTNKGSVKMSKGPGRNTTFQERLEIVQFTISNELAYGKAIEKYGVNYHQVYRWVRKYQQYGELGLQDNRGRKKKTDSLTEEDRLKLRIKELENKNRFLEMEVTVQKS